MKNTTLTCQLCTGENNASKALNTTNIFTVCTSVHIKLSQLTEHGLNLWDCVNLNCHLWNFFIPNWFVRLFQFRLCTSIPAFLPQLSYETAPKMKTIQSWSDKCINHNFQIFTWKKLQVCNRPQMEVSSNNSTN